MSDKDDLLPFPKNLSPSERLPSIYPLHKAMFIDPYLEKNNYTLFSSSFYKQDYFLNRDIVNLRGNVGVEVRNGYGVVSNSRNTCASRGVFEKELFTDLKLL